MRKKLQGLNRRELLVILGAATGASMRPAAAKAQSAVDRPAETTLIPRRLLFGDPGKLVVRISPDGKRIAFLAPVNGVLNLWVSPIDDLAKARALTRADDRDLGWSSGCTTIATSFSRAGRWDENRWPIAWILRPARSLRSHRGPA
jgi:hypothetical protein